MKIIKDKKIIVLIIVLTVFTIGYFVIANQVSYAFSANYDAADTYNKTIEVIKASAIVYAENNEKLFEKENTIYVKVQDLIDNNLLAADQEGNILNPLKANASLNSNVIKIKKEDGKITVEVDS